MYFINPLFLIGLIAVVIPVIIHLFQFRRFKKEYFSDISLIKEIQIETKKQAKLKHLIVLLLRILAIIALVLAFAQPFIPSNNQVVIPKAKHYVGIYSDNSFSMLAECKNINLLNEARNKALEIAAAYKGSDFLQLLTNEFEAKHRQFQNLEDFTSFVDEIQPAPASRELQEILVRFRETFKNTGKGARQIYIISDFQKSKEFPGKGNFDSTVNYFLVPLRSNSTANIYIDSCWFGSPVHLINQKTRLYVRVVNKSDAAVEKIPLKLSFNNSQKAVTSLSIAPNSFTDVLISYSETEKGLHKGVLEIIDNPVVFDDRFYFSYNIQPAIPVLCINGTHSTAYLNMLFNKDSSFEYSSVNEKQVDYSSFSQKNLIILNELKEISTGMSQEIQKFVNNGGDLLLIPAKDMNIAEYNRMLQPFGIKGYSQVQKISQKINFINLQSEIYTDVFEGMPENIDLPKTQMYYNIQQSTTDQVEVLLRMMNSDAFLSQYLVGRSKIYLLSTPLQTEFSNFARHALFVPTLYNIALNSSESSKLFYNLGSGNNEIELPFSANSETDQVFVMKHTESNKEIIPAYRNIQGKHVLVFGEEIQEAGNYMILKNNQEVTAVSMNYDREESDLECYTEEELGMMIEKNGLTNVNLINSAGKPINKVIEKMNSGTGLWKTFILFALLFLLAEVLLLRFWK